MSMDFVLSNARIVTGSEVIHGALTVRDGRIESVDAGATAVPEAIDMDGDTLIPGLIELHTDHFETQAYPRPAVRWPTTQALIAHDAAVFNAGITTVFNAIAVGHDAGKKAYRQALCDEVLTTLDESADLLRAEHLVHLRCEVTGSRMAEQFDRNRDNPRVRLVSVMDHTPGQRQFVSLDKYREYYMGKYDVPADDMERMIEDRLALQDRYAPDNRAHVTQWCREHGITMASHDDANEEHVATATAEGIAISEFPTTLEAARAARGAGMTTVAGGPNMVRGGSHSGNVGAAELARAGVLDAFSSDYVPNSLLLAAWSLQNDGWTLPRAMATVSANPAAMLGLADRGRLAPGARADLVRVTERAHGPVVRRVWREGRSHA